MLPVIGILFVAISIYIFYIIFKKDKKSADTTFP